MNIGYSMQYFYVLFAILLILDINELGIYNGGFTTVKCRYSTNPNLVFVNLAQKCGQIWSIEL